jgi:hypothetical protein
MISVTSVSGTFHYILYLKYPFLFSGKFIILWWPIITVLTSNTINTSKLIHWESNWIYNTNSTQHGRSRDSAISTQSNYRLNGTGIKPQQNQELFSPPKPSRQFVGPTPPLI